MDFAPTVLLVLGTLLGPLVPGACAPAHWTLFQSRSEHFSVCYPPSWSRLAGLDGVPDTDVLDIINFPNSQRAKGVVIKEGGAEIMVGGPPESVPSLDGWIHASLRYGALIDRGQVPIAAPSSDGCSRLDLVATRGKMDDSHTINTSYYCTVGSRFYRILLTNWEGDPHQAKLQDIALKIALSLRSR